MTKEIVTSMEMTELGQLRPSRPPPEPIELDEVGASMADALRSIYVRVWEPLASRGRMEWSAGDWETELLRSGVKAWLPRVGGETVGLAELKLEPTGDVGIVVFGLVPEFTGRGFGGAFLTATVRLAWNMSSERPVRRVWVQTSSGDHPNAIANYKSRGFVKFQTQPDMPTGVASSVGPEFGNDSRTQDRWQFRGNLQLHAGVPMKS
jgi:GNAT superfamily N-acetyltransferase